MKAVQDDLFAERGTFEALMQRRLPAADLLVISDVASALNITRSKVLELIEEGMIQAVNLNMGTPLRPFYKVMRESVLAYARRLDKGW
ncbi:MAG: hypothetical protein IKW38_05545 [Kiritimatiellae bacterium]|nr:hypothetical protein [Kiritimatiellia bacterium]